MAGTSVIDKALWERHPHMLNLPLPHLATFDGPRVSTFMNGRYGTSLATSCYLSGGGDSPAPLVPPRYNL